MSSGLELRKIRCFAVSESEISRNSICTQPSALESLPSSESKWDNATSRDGPPKSLSSTSSGLWRNLLSQKLKSNIDCDLRKSSGFESADERNLQRQSRPSTASSSQSRSARNKRKDFSSQPSSSIETNLASSLANTVPEYLPSYQTFTSNRPRSASPSLTMPALSSEENLRPELYNAGARPSSADPSSQPNRKLQNHSDANPRNLLREQLIASTKQQVDPRPAVEITNEDKRDEDEFDKFLTTLQSMKESIPKDEALAHTVAPNPAPSRPTSRNGRRGKDRLKNTNHDHTRRLSQNKVEALRKVVSRHVSDVDRQYAVIAQV